MYLLLLIGILSVFICRYALNKYLSSDTNIKFVLRFTGKVQTSYFFNKNTIKSSISEACKLQNYTQAEVYKNQEDIRLNTELEDREYYCDIIPVKKVLIWWFPVN